MEQLLKCHRGSRNLKKMDKVRDCFFPEDFYRSSGSKGGLRS